jgi:hypothetical protein
VTKSLRWFRHPTPLFIGFSLTRPICVIQFISGNTARSFGVRQLAAAFLPFTQQPVAHRQIRSLWNQSLTNCRLFNSFVLKFMHETGGGGVLQKLDFPISYTPPTIPFLFILLRTLLHSFAGSENSTPLFSTVSALFDKKPGVGVPLRKISNGFWLAQERVLPGSLAGLFCRMSNLSAVI